MAGSQQNGAVNGTKQQPAQAEADFAQAFKELAQGERQAAQMEGQLDALEKKIDELLADAERQQSQRGASMSQNEAESKTADKSQQP